MNALTDRITGDDVDLAVISALVESPRCSYSDLARRVGISDAAAQAKVRRLRESNGIKIVGRINPAILGCGVFAFVLVGVGGSALQAAELLSGHLETAFVVVVGGSAGVFAELRCSDTHHLKRVMGDSRLELKSASMRLAIVESYYKHDWSTFHSGAVKNNICPSYHVDDIDMGIIKILVVDGRATYADIARQVYVSPGTARQRVRHLQETGALTIQVMVAPRLLGLAGYAAVGISVEGPVEMIAQHIVQQKPAALVASVLGAFDIVVEVCYRDLRDLAETLDALRDLPQVTQIESFPYLTEIKESMEVGLWSKVSQN